MKVSRQELENFIENYNTVPRHKIKEDSNLYKQIQIVGGYTKASENYLISYKRTLRNYLTISIFYILIITFFLWENYITFYSDSSQNLIQYTVHLWLIVFWIYNFFSLYINGHKTYEYELFLKKEK